METQNGASTPFVSGETLYYTRTDREGADLWSMPSAGGGEKKLPFQVSRRNVQVCDDGIYYITWEPEHERHEIRFYRFHDKRIETIARLPKRIGLI